jgi:hypothetical protein
MAGLDPAIHGAPNSGQRITIRRYSAGPRRRHRVDGRIKSGHDDNFTRGVH